MYVAGSRAYQTFSDPLAWRYPAALVTATLAVSPPSLDTNTSSTVTWTGSGTSWLSSTPTFTPTGVSGVSVGSITYDSDTQAHATVTTGTNTGTITWTDSSTSATANQFVQFGGRSHVFVIPIPFQYYRPDFV